MVITLARAYDLVPKLYLRSSDWLMNAYGTSELGYYFVCSLISGFNDDAATLGEMKEEH